MNFKQVLKAYAILRNLTDDESALLETLRGLSEGEREQLVESLSPGKATTKKAAKKSTGKSQRASGMAAAIKRSLESQQRVTEPNCGTCGNSEDFADHSQPSPHYHPFAPPSTARGAAGKSSANGAANSSIANSEDETENAAAVAGGSNE